MQMLRHCCYLIMLNISEKEIMKVSLTQITLTLLVGDISTGGIWASFCPSWCMLEGTMCVPLGDSTMEGCVPWVQSGQSEQAGQDMLLGTPLPPMDFMPNDPFAFCASNSTRREAMACIWFALSSNFPN